MNENIYNYGMIGLGTMGSNLVLNIADHGFSVAGYDRDTTKVDALNALAEKRTLKAFPTIQEFVSSLSSPRVILLLVPAGAIVNKVIDELKPLLNQGDIIIDCGNSHFVDTQLRIDALAKDGLHFMGLGVSGGETGARLGPSIMPGGDREAYEKIATMLQAVAAKMNGEPCTAYMGSGAAGHYVKMVHNGIEYALMQMIAEAYDVLKANGLSNAQQHEIFKGWNGGRLRSFLIEITAEIFLQPDADGEGELLDKILGAAHQKGTGAWMSQDAMATGSPIPAIDAAVSARSLSSLKEERNAAAKLFTKATGIAAGYDKLTLVEDLEKALYAGFVLSYAQGLAMLQVASDFHKYGTDIKTVAKIWRGGCIIRAALLEEITDVYARNADIRNMLLSPEFSAVMNTETPALRKVIGYAVGAGLPLPSLSAALNYFDAYRRSWLPANMIQAQRDFFGAHTYERIDKEGSFHTEWNATVQ